MSFPPCWRCGLVILLLACGSSLHAAEAADTERGDRMLRAYLRAQTQQLMDNSLKDVRTRADWEQRRPELRRQFLDMMGLWPLPRRTDLKPVITGKVETEHFTIEKLHFQSMPGLYVTGNLYLPKHLTKPAPTILYVCGHGNTVVDKVSFGSKVTYQHHPAWFAENGYVCLVIDTLQLGEIEGIHHGTARFGMWWWYTLGYTPAGVECWNGMRALDFLETRKEVDPKRIGVTGRSGGGAYSWFLAAADDRPQCFVPVAGIADLWAHVVEGVGPRLRWGITPGHCDCMYFPNTYQWDFATVAALAAPRPCLLGNSDVDDIFPVSSYRRIGAKVRRIYDLYGAGEKFDLLETPGPHKDTPALRQGAFAWMNRWLKDDRSEPAQPERPRLNPPQLKVFARLPEDQINTSVQELFVKPAVADVPRVPEVARAWWAGKAPQYREGLRDQVFRAWPAKAPALKPALAGDVKHNGLRLRAFDFTSEEHINLRLFLLTAEKTEKPTLVVLDPVDEAGWLDFQQVLGPEFKDVLQLRTEPKLDEARSALNQRVLEKQQWAFATIAPRGIGPTRWGPPQAAERDQTHVLRRFALLGQTLDSQRVWDVRRALAVLRGMEDLKDAPRWLQAKHDMAGIALYAGLFEPDVARFDLWHLPDSHRQGPTFLNVRRILDLPQAVALAFPRPVRLYVNDARTGRAWDWPLELQKALGQEYLKIRVIGD